MSARDFFDAIIESLTKSIEDINERSVEDRLNQYLEYLDDGFEECVITLVDQWGENDCPRVKKCD
jgi:hypothetical protein